jgi:hypothetical protein
MKDLLKGEKCIKQVQAIVHAKKCIGLEQNCLKKGLEMVSTINKSSFSQMYCKGLKVILVYRSV